MNDFLQRLAASPWETLGPWLPVLPAALMLLAAAAAVVLRNLIHAALCLTLSFIALGILYMALGAEFVGLAQLLVHVGAVAMLLVFAILLTRPEQLRRAASPFAGPGPLAGGAIALAVLVMLLAAIFRSPEIRTVTTPPVPKAPVADIGRLLVGDAFPALMVTGVLLTAALVGAAVMALEEKKP